MYMYTRFINIMGSFVNLHMFPLMVEAEIFSETLETKFIFEWQIIIEEYFFPCSCCESVAFRILLNLFCDTQLLGVAVMHTRLLCGRFLLQISQWLS
jgi:hypothetical protein